MDSVFFEIAKPIVKDKFIARYRDTIKLNQLLFAPFGLNSLAQKVLGEEVSVKEYSLVFQQWQDLTTKLVFSEQGVDDDQIMASMHKFVGSQQDREFIHELELTAKIVENSFEPPKIVLFDMNTSDPRVPSSSSAVEQEGNATDSFELNVCTASVAALLLDQVLTALRAVKSHMNSSACSDLPAVAVDEVIRRRFGIVIPKHLFSPQTVFGTKLNAKYGPHEELRQLLVHVGRALQLPWSKLRRQGSDDGRADKAVLTFTQVQYEALLDLFFASDEVQAVICRHISSSSNGNENDSKMFLGNVYSLQDLQGGALFVELNFAAHPLVAYVSALGRQLEDMDEAAAATTVVADSVEATSDLDEEDADVEEGEEWEDVDSDEESDERDSASGEQEEAVAPQKNARDRSPAAKYLRKCIEVALETVEVLSKATGMAEEDPERACGLLSKQMKKYMRSGEAGNKSSISSTASTTTEVIVPVYLQVGVLMQLASMHAMLGEEEKALGYADEALVLDKHCIAAYTLKAQVVSEKHAMMQMEQEQWGIVPDKQSSSASGRLIEKAAKDSFTAYLLGGSVDFALAAMTEEVARESVRTHAKEAYFENRARNSASTENRCALSDAVGSLDLKSSHMSSVETVAAAPLDVLSAINAELLRSTLHSTAADTLPRPWLVGSYFAGHKLLSVAFNLPILKTSEEGVDTEKSHHALAHAEEQLTESEAENVMLKGLPAWLTNAEEFSDESVGCSGSSRKEVLAVNIKAYRLLRDAVELLESIEDNASREEVPAATTPRTESSGSSSSHIDIAVEGAVDADVDDVVERAEQETEQQEEEEEDGDAESVAPIPACLTKVDACGRPANNVLALMGLHCHGMNGAEPGDVVSALIGNGFAVVEEGCAGTRASTAAPASAASVSAASVSAALSSSSSAAKSSKEPKTEIFATSVPPCEQFISVLSLLRQPFAESVTGVTFNERGCVIAATQIGYTEDEIIYGDADAADDETAENGTKSGANSQSRKPVLPFATSKLQQARKLQEKRKIEEERKKKKREENIDSDGIGADGDDENNDDDDEGDDDPYAAFNRGYSDDEKSESSELCDEDVVENAQRLHDLIYGSNLDLMSITASSTFASSAPTSPAGTVTSGAHDTAHVPVALKLRSRLLSLCGSVAFLSGDAAGAARCFRLSLRYERSLVDTQVKLGSLLSDMDESDDAELLLSNALRSSAHGVTGYTAVVQVHFSELEISRNDFEAAAAHLRKAQSVAMEALNAHDKEESVAFDSYCKRLSTAQSASEEHNIGGNSRSRVDVDNARNELRRVLRLIANERELLANITALLGVCTFRLAPEQPEQALRTLQKGITALENAAPGAASARSGGLFAAAFGFGSRKEKTRSSPSSSSRSEGQRRRRCRSWRTPTMLLACNGEVAGQAGDMVGALRSFRQAHRGSPQHPLPLVNAARIYSQLGQHSTAGTHLREALKADPSLSMCRVDLAQNLLQAGRPQEALMTLERAIKLARHVSEIKDALTAQYVAKLQLELEKEGIC